MSARDRILGRIRRSTQAVAGGALAGERTRPALARPADRVAQFVAQAEAVQATTTRLASADELATAVAAELRKRNLPAAIRTGADPMFDRDWGTVERTTGVGRLAEPVTMTRAECGLAETGSLVFASGPDNPVTLNFLGETHFAVVHARDLQDGFEDLWAVWREKGIDPRTVNLVTGPSRSGDLGQKIQLGAHGPVALHIFLIEDA